MRSIARWIATSMPIFLIAGAVRSAPVTYRWSGIVIYNIGASDSVPLGSTMSGTFDYDSEHPWSSTTTEVGSSSFSTYNDRHPDTATSPGFLADGINQTHTLRFSVKAEVISLLSSDLTVFPGPAYPTRLPPISKFNYEHEYSSLSAGWLGYRVSITNLVAVDETGPPIETKILGLSRLGTNVQINFRAPSSATVFLQRQTAQNVWQDIAGVGGYNGFIITALPTNGFGIFRLKSTNP